MSASSNERPTVPSQNNGVIHSGVRNGKSSNSRKADDSTGKSSNSQTRSAKGIEYLPKNGQLNYEESLIVSPRLPEDVPSMVKLFAVDTKEEKKKSNSGKRSSRKKKSNPKPKSANIHPIVIEEYKGPSPNIAAFDELNDVRRSMTRQSDGSDRYIVRSLSRSGERNPSPPSSKIKSPRSNTDQPKSNRRSTPNSQSRSRTRTDQTPKSSSRRKESSSNPRSSSKKNLSNTSSPLQAVSDGPKSNKRENTHYNNSSVIGDSAPSNTRSYVKTTPSVSTERPDFLSDNTTDDESSSNRKPEIFMGGERVGSDAKRSSNVDKSTRRRKKGSSSQKKLQDQKKALDATLNEPGEENLESAVHKALNMTRQKAVIDAKENDEPIRAAFLGSMNRPNDLSDAIDELVSMRRSEIRNAKESKIRESRVRESTKRRGKNKPQTSKPAPSLDDEDPIIETMDEDQYDDYIDSWVDEEHSDSIHRSFRRHEKNFIMEQEDMVDLPNAMRKAKVGEKYALGPADALGQRDNVYDPLNADVEFNPRNRIIGKDNPYEESDEDEDLMTIEERKDEMIYRFKLLQEAYPGIALPRITMRMKLSKMVRHYEFVESRLKLKTKTKNLRIVMVLAFLGMQFGVKWLTGLNTAGFTYNQMQCIGIYEKYLREFGESDWSAFGENTSIWIRLPFAMGINFAIFMAAKYAMKYTNKDHTAEFHKLYGELTGDDSYTYLNASNTAAGLDAGEEGEGGAGGLFGMLQKLVGMFGGGAGGGGGLGGLASMFGGGSDNKDRPARGTTGGPTYVREPRTQ
jgi:hypothetical protein